MNTRLFPEAEPFPGLKHRIQRDGDGEHWVVTVHHNRMITSCRDLDRDAAVARAQRIVARESRRP